MSYIPQINQTATAQQAVNPQDSQTGSKEKTLGQQDFLTLLVAQLQNQDPLNPSDPTEFTSQLAQYSQLEQLFNLNDSMEQLAKSQESTDRITALSMIGQDVIAPGTTLTLGDGTVEIGYRLDAPASDIAIHIRNAQGQRVATLHPADLTTGTHFVTWSGLGDNGERLDEGTYTLMVEAQSMDGEPVNVTGLVHARVTGVDMGDEGIRVITETGTVSLDDITTVAAPPDNQTDTEGENDATTVVADNDGTASLLTDTVESVQGAVEVLDDMTE